METSLNRNVDKAISKYLNQADNYFKDRNEAWASLAWSIYDNENSQNTPEYLDIKNNLPTALVDSNFSIRKFLSEEEYNLLMANPKAVIDAVCHNYSTSPFFYNDIHSDEEIIARFMAKIAAPKTNDSIYLPFAGLGTVIDFLPDNSNIVAGEEIEPAIWALSRIRNSVFHSKIDVKGIRIGDSFETMESSKRQFEKHLINNRNGALFDGEYNVITDDPKYDLIIMSPPYAPDKGDIQKTGKKWQKAVSMAIGLLKNDGRLVVAIPLNFITRQINKTFISPLLDRQILKRVVGLKSPMESFKKSEINEHFSSMAILEISQKPVQEVELIDVMAVIPEIFKLSGEDLEDAIDRCLEPTSDYRMGVSRMKREEIKNGIILPSYYTAFESTINNPHISIEECLSEIQTLNNNTIEEIPTVNIRDLSNNYLDCEIDISNLFKLSGTKLPNHKILTQSALLIGFSPKQNLSIGKINLSDGQKVLLGTNVIPFAIKTDKVNPDYLIKELSNSRFLEFYINPSEVSNYSHAPEGFYDLIIPCPDLETQYVIVLDDVRNSFNQKQAELVEFTQKHTTEIRLRRHTLSTKFTSLRNNWKFLMNTLRKNGGNIDLEQDGKWLEKIIDSIDTIGTHLDLLIESQEDFGNNIPVNPDALIDSYCESYTNSSSTFRFLRAEPTDDSIKICIPWRAFERIMNNIVRNAESHGFCDSERKDYIISIETLVDGNNVYINISNNGSSLNDKISPEDVFELGRSSSLHLHNHEGQGGYEIRKIMEMFGGEVSVISTPESEFKVTYKLKFKKYGTE